MNRPYALIIDDNPDNSEVLAALLGQEGVACTVLQDPTQLGTTVGQLKSALDVVFCDLEMPKLNGYHLLAQLRELLGHSVRIIAYTVHLSEIETVRRMGFDGFLGKPVDAEQFPANLRRILNGQAIWEIQ